MAEKDNLMLIEGDNLMSPLAPDSTADDTGRFLDHRSLSVAQRSTIPIIIDDLIDGARLRGRLVTLVATLLLVMIIDGVDVMMLAYASPVIIAQWGITKWNFAGAMSAAPLGMAVGSLVGGWIGDRFGRRRSLIGAVLVFGLATIACGRATNVPELMALRFVSGLGFGACFPSVNSLAAEWLPRRLVSQVVGLINVGPPVGGMLGALLAAATLSNFGWQVTFFATGAVSLAIALFAMLALLESPFWLALRDRHEEAGRSLARFGLLDRTALSNVRFRSRSELDEDAGTSGTKLFARSNLRTNVGLIAAFFLNGLAVVLIFSWAPSMLTTAGLSVSESMKCAFALQAISVGGGIFASFVAARTGTRPLLLTLGGIAVLTCAGVAVLLAVGAFDRTTSLGAGLVAASACLPAIQTLLYVIASKAYPPEIRAMGNGLGSTASKVGQVLSGVVGGAILTFQSESVFFVLIAMLLALVCGAALILNRHVGPAGQVG
jgi:AAHS family 4-hydroxybenzoate transporter-like MFS transporter